MQSHRLWLSLFLVLFIKKRDFLRAHGDAVRLSPLEFCSTAGGALAASDWWLVPATCALIGQMPRRYQGVRASVGWERECGRFSRGTRLWGRSDGEAHLSHPPALLSRRSGAAADGAAEGHQIIKRRQCGFLVLPALSQLRRAVHETGIPAKCTASPSNFIWPFSLFNLYKVVRFINLMLERIA